MILKVDTERRGRYGIATGAGTIAVYYRDPNILYIQSDYYNRNRLAGVAEELRDYVSNIFQTPPEYIDVRLSEDLNEDLV